MTGELQEHWNPGLRVLEIVQEAKAALVSMDAKRLEELAGYCCDIRDRVEAVNAEASLFAQELWQDIDLEKRILLELQMLECMLFETRANLSVLSRLRMEWWDKSAAGFCKRALTFNPTAQPGKGGREWEQSTMHSA